MLHRFFMKDETIVLLGLGGAALYFLSKSNFFQGLGEVGTGLGDAVTGLGSGISTIGQEAGDIVVDVGSVVEPLASFFQGSANLIATAYENKNRSLIQEGKQALIVDEGAFAQSQEQLSQIQAVGDINTANEQQKRRSLLEDNKTDFVRYFTNLDENALAIAKSSAAAVTGAIADAKRKIETSAASISAIPQVVLGNKSALNLASSISNILTGKASGSTQTAQEIAKERALETSANKNKLSYVQTAAVKAVSSVTTKAKSLLSSVSKKLKSIF